ncbi:MAG: hypothetical protein ABI615_06740 [Chthoniobacterales bacterium]
MNRIAVRPLAAWLLAIFLAGAAGLCFVYLKNQQHVLGDQTRRYEKALAETNAKIEVVDAKITSLTSRTALLHRVQDGFIKLVPIEDTKIARLVPPGVEPVRRTGEIRTAANERRLQ